MSLTPSADFCIEALEEARPPRPTGDPQQRPGIAIYQLTSAEFLKALVGHEDRHRSRAESVPAEPGRPLYIIVLSRYLNHQTILSGWISL